ncbi:MAG: glycosyltransferase family 39 protein [Elusimicrobiota bacterium]|jgi:undecaprenyl-diphosphatase|nr:glycosyltransferase family 39 protein [Elusimicrobiota bacterium]
MEKLFNKKNTIIFVGLTALFKTFLSATLELHPDEAYYWLWSKRLAFGYFDHSPMVAYFIKLTTLFSHNELAVRFSGLIVLIIMSILIWKFVKNLFGETAAAASIFALNSMPIMFIGSIVITPDTPAFLFFSCAVYTLWQLISTNKTKFWYLTGIFFGLALLSKYTAVLFCLCLAVYMVLDKKLFWLKNVHFYLMFLISLTIFLPVVFWNSSHDWISFTFQIGHGLVSSKLHFNYIFEYLAAQAGVIGPITFIAGVIASFYYFGSKESKKVFLASFCIPVIVFFMFTAIKRYPGANWPSVAYLPFAVMAAQFMLSNVKKRKIFIWGIVLNVFCSVLIGIHMKYSIFPVAKISPQLAVLDTTNWFRGWKELSDALMKRKIVYAVTKQHQWSATIEYYTDLKIASFVSADRTNEYGIWWTKEPADYQTSKKAVVWVDYEMDKDYSEDIAAFPPNATELIVIKRMGQPIRQYLIIEFGDS